MALLDKSAFANIFDFICFRAYTVPWMSHEISIHSFVIVIFLMFLKVLTLVKTTISQKGLLKINYPNIAIKYLFLKEREFSSSKSSKKK